jgi:hypothetical protein
MPLESEPDLDPQFSFEAVSRAEFEKRWALLAISG